VFLASIAWQTRRKDRSSSRWNWKGGLCPRTKAAEIAKLIDDYVKAYQTAELNDRVALSANASARAPRCMVRWRQSEQNCVLSFLILTVPARAVLSNSTYPKNGSGPA
jgi:hypothetical protein